MIIQFTGDGLGYDNSRFPVSSRMPIPPLDMRLGITLTQPSPSSAASLTKQLSHTPSDIGFILMNKTGMAKGGDA